MAVPTRSSGAARFILSKLPSSGMQVANEGVDIAWQVKKNSRQIQLAAVER